MSLRGLLDDEEASWREICRLFDLVVGENWLKPGANDDWTPKDVMAHFAAWHALTTDRLECLRSTGDMPPPRDVDAFNAEQHERRKDVLLHDVQASFFASRHRFREEVALLDEPLSERLTKIIFANGTGHYAEHRPALEAFIKEHV